MRSFLRRLLAASCVALSLSAGLGPTVRTEDAPAPAPASAEPAATTEAAPAAPAPAPGPAPAPAPAPKAEPAPAPPSAEAAKTEPPPPPAAPAPKTEPAPTPAPAPKAEPAPASAEPAATTEAAPAAPAPAPEPAPAPAPAPKAEPAPAPPSAEAAKTEAPPPPAAPEPTPKPEPPPAPAPDPKADPTPEPEAEPTEAAKPAPAPAAPAAPPPPPPATTEAAPSGEPEPSAPPSAGPQTSAPESPPPAVRTLDTGATAWMLVSSALVLLMTPGLALFYGGMVRSRNVLGTMLQSLFCMGIVTVQWVLIGYTLSFGTPTAGGLIGGLDYLFLDGVTPEALFPDTGIPRMVHMVFQMMFAIITPALITGAFAERVKFGAFVVFSLLWSTLVYDPVAHWVWGGGILSFSDRSWLVGMLGTGGLDFAGGTVVHLSAGVSALVFAIMIGKRRDYPAQPVLPHNLVLTVTGAGLLWFGWFGFNGGSALFANEQAGLAFASTHVCAAAASVSWAAIEWWHRGKASALGVATGLVAGLVCITPGSGYVSCVGALALGAIVSPVCYFFVAVVKHRLGYDDSLDAFGVHGIGGAVGAILTGVFCSSFLPAGAAAGFRQVLAQLVAVGIAAAYAAAVTAAIVYVVDRTMGIRVPDDEELTGLDLARHGERAYNA